MMKRAFFPFPYSSTVVRCISRLGSENFRYRANLLQEIGVIGRVNQNEF